MMDLGLIRPGSTLRIPFGSFAAATGAPSAVTNYADADIQVFKDGNTTQRASSSGITATTSFDALTGINLASIDLSDNTTAGFWSAGSEYIVVVGDITVDSQTLRMPIGRFRIGVPGEIFSTTIATLASQTSFTLTAGPAEDDALNGCTLYFHDVASAVQSGFGVVLDYVGSTKTVTLSKATTWTLATSDNVSVIPPSSVAAIDGNTTAAINLALSAADIVLATVTTGASTTSIPTSACTPAGAVADQFKGRIVIFRSDTDTTSLRGQSTDITASSNSATPTFTVTALTTAPSSGDTFIVL